MATSQFTIYSSSDPYGPGPMTGQVGSLTRILDACLINGYGTGSFAKPSAGWLRPLPSISGSNVACYQQPSGSQFTLFINDNSPTVANEAWAVGWINMISMSGAVNSQNVGVGYGQFPLPYQALTYGKTIWRKSNTADAVQRSWILAADAYTMYIWMADGYSVGYYYHGGFGDFFSNYGAADKGRCLLFGKYGENTANVGSYEYSDAIIQGQQWANSAVQMNSYFPGHYVARAPSGNGSSLRYNKKGDFGVSQGGIGANNEGPYCVQMNGMLACPNPTDNSYYLSPIWVVDIQGPALRGKYRGIWQVCHPLTNFSLGQIIQGSGTLAGRTFMVIYYGYNGGGWAVETSPTVNTN